jgi:hypothetical protein
MKRLIFIGVRVGNESDCAKPELSIGVTPMGLVTYSYNSGFHPRDTIKRSAESLADAFNEVRKLIGSAPILSIRKKSLSTY